MRNHIGPFTLRGRQWVMEFTVRGGVKLTAVVSYEGHGLHTIGIGLVAGPLAGAWACLEGKTVRAYRKRAMAQAYDIAKRFADLPAWAPHTRWASQMQRSSG
jgi:hypothetical protein